MAETGPYDHLPVQDYFASWADGIEVSERIDIGTVFLVDTPTPERQFALEVTDASLYHPPKGMLSILQGGQVKDSRLPDFQITLGKAEVQTSTGFTGRRVELLQPNDTGSLKYTVPVGAVRAIMSPQLAVAIRREKQRVERETLINTPGVQEALPHLVRYFRLLVEHDVNPDAASQLEAVRIQLGHLLAELK